MANKPFTSQCTNVYNETSYNSIPNAFGLRNVTATQAHDRTVYDRLSTCVASNCLPNMPMPSSNCDCDFNTSQVIYGQPQLTSRGGVTFTFNTAPAPQLHNLQSFSSGGTPLNHFQQMHQASQQPCQQPLTLQQQIALKQLEQQGLELMVIQEQLKRNPYKLQFHHNGQTSTTNLSCEQSQVPPSGGMPDLKNALATLADLKRDIASLGIDKLSPTAPTNSLYSEVYKAKRLILTKSPDLLYKDKPKPSNSCITNEGTDSQLEKNKSTSKQANATTSRRKSSDEKKTKRQCKKSKKKPSKSKRNGRRSNAELSESLLDHDSNSEEFDDYNDFDDDSVSESDH